MLISIRPSSKNVDSIYIIKDLYLRDVRGKKASLNPSGKERTTVTVKKLGRIPDLMNEMNLSRDEVIAWAKEQARIMTEEEKKNNEKISVDFYPNQLIDKDVERLLSCGYLFLQSLYSDLRLHLRYSFQGSGSLRRFQPLRLLLKQLTLRLYPVLFPSST